MNRLIARLAIGAFFLSATALAQTSATSSRRYALPDHGHLVLPVPVDWEDRVGEAPNRMPPTIRFTPPSGESFKILITPIWPIPKDRPPQSGDEMRAGVERAAQGLKPRAVETELPIVEFPGRSGAGFYFSATDRAPQPGEYKYLTQGIVRIGELSVTFTILTNDGQEAVVKQALEALKGASQESP